MNFTFLGLGTGGIGLVSSLLGTVDSAGHFYSNTTMTPFLLSLSIIFFGLEIILKNKQVKKK